MKEWSLKRRWRGGSNWINMVKMVDDLVYGGNLYVIVKIQFINVQKRRMGAYYGRKNGVNDSR